MNTVLPSFFGLEDLIWSEADNRLVWQLRGKHLSEQSAGTEYETIC